MNVGKITRSIFVHTLSDAGIRLGFPCSYIGGSLSALLGMFKTGLAEVVETFMVVFLEQLHQQRSIEIGVIIHVTKPPVKQGKFSLWYWVNLHS